MKSAYLPSFALIISVAMLLQPEVFAVENPNPEAVEIHTGARVAKADQLYTELNDKDGSQEFDGNEGVSLLPGQALPVLDIQVGGE
ncbi:MAG TPA: hypothetical protein ENH23_06925, partial [candidate division Zixibacteria bacterium]|nr:hypothetical protein [candidate division Zixibacteria bacterium]